MLLRLSKLASFAEGGSLSSLPGIAPDPREGAAALQKDMVANGTEKRLLGAKGVGIAMKQQQGPRAYAPRLSKPLL